MQARLQLPTMDADASRLQQSPSSPAGDAIRRRQVGHPQEEYHFRRRSRQGSAAGTPGKGKSKPIDAEDDMARGMECASRTHASNSARSVRQSINNCQPQPVKLLSVWESLRTTPGFYFNLKLNPLGMLEPKWLEPKWLRMLLLLLLLLLLLFLSKNANIQQSSAALYQ